MRFIYLILVLTVYTYPDLIVDYCPNNETECLIYAYEIDSYSFDYTETEIERPKPFEAMNYEEVLDFMGHDFGL